MPWALADVSALAMMSTSRSAPPAAARHICRILQGARAKTGRSLSTKSSEVITFGDKNGRLYLFVVRFIVDEFIALVFIVFWLI